MTPGTADPAPPDAAERGERGERERWTRAALVTPGLMFLTLVTIAARPGAPLGPLAYATGLPLLGTLALLQILHGLVSSLWRPPVVRPARLRAFLILAATAFLAVLPIPYPSSHAGQPSAVTFALPVRGTWQVVLGGDRPFDNTLVLVPQLRYALVFSREPGAARERGREASEPVFGAPVYAPADARVVEVEGRLPDARHAPDSSGNPAAGGESAPLAHRAGNRVVLEVGAGEYLFLVGLQQGSPTVAAGERVTRGQLVGRVGRSAHLAPGSADHFLFHLQDQPAWGEGEGIPWRFGPYEVVRAGAGERAEDPSGQLVERGRPGLGELLRAVQPGAHEAPVGADPAPDQNPDRFGD